MVDFCAAHGIQLLCYGTVAGGFLSERYLDAPEPAAPHENRSLTKYHLIIEEFGGWGEVATEFFDPENGSVAAIEEELGVSTE